MSGAIRYMLMKTITLPVFAVLILLMSLTGFVAGATGSTDTISVLMPPETLRYNVMFKWGLINKKAGTAALTLSHAPSGYRAMLAAASEPWADRFYRVRDTLNGRMEYVGSRPLYYEKIAHEGGDFKHDEVRYDYSTPGKVYGHCRHRAYEHDELRVDQSHTLEADSAALDMLTAFYYMRSLPYETMQTGDTFSIDIFSGRRKELLTIHYSGSEIVKIDGQRLPAYHITFTFTSKGGSKTSDDMDAWIGTTPQRIPLKMEGKLPVGKVRCLYAPQQ